MMPRLNAWHSTCRCGKRSYADRKAAKLARKHTGGSGLSVYRCPLSDSWHIGHTPYLINRGISSRNDFRGGAA